MSDTPALRTQTLPQPVPRRVLAFGAWLKNTACRIDGRTVSWSALHGDLAEPAQCLALEASIEALLALGPVDAIAHDLHPDFFSTRLAQSWAARLGVPAIGVQHHHAHAAALQAEHGLRGPVIGLALDGVGLGDDGTAWGGELLWADGAAWQRLGALTPLHLPGGDAAAQEPWRMAAATLHALGRDDEIAPRLAPAHGETGTRLLRSMLDKQLNCPLTTSAGRWFDAAAGALGLGGKQAFEAQAAIALEQFATAWLNEHSLAPDASLTPLHAGGGLNLLPLMASIWSLSEAGQAVTPEQQGQGAALFHVNLADGLARWAVAAARRHGLDTIVLGGGCFYNRLLVQRLLDGVRQHSLASGPEPLHVLQAQALSCGDAGLALGQAWAVAGAHDLSLSVLPASRPSYVLP
jgi:hydrogenase maturation protein HypF